MFVPERHFRKNIVPYTNMTKLMITYRATIDRYVPIAVRSRFVKSSSARRGRFLVIRERIRFMA
jgi:hypothetical protein